MDDQGNGKSEDHLITKFTQSQIQHFREADPSCRALELPEGIMLRYTLAEALYFYLRTAVNDGKIVTRVFASDSPYDRLKAAIGDVLTPMFEANADWKHFKKLEALLHGWVNFVKHEPDAGSNFRSFEVQDQ